MDKLTKEKIKELRLRANEIRQSIVEMLVEAGSGHTAGSLGMTDVFTFLYFHALRHDPKNPNWLNRDRVVLSNGHICPVLYATLSSVGYIPKSELLTLRRLGSRLQGHPHREWLPILETSSGPLGSGLSQAVGMAIADRIDSGKNTEKTIYALLSDGEHDEGNTWEAIMLAGKEKLRNLIAIVDRNKIQIDGNTEDVMPLGDLARKYERFGWYAQNVDGHDFEALNDAISRAKLINEKPSVIIAITTPGKGVKEFENDYRWHGIPPNKEQGSVAIKELKEAREKILNS